MFSLGVGERSTDVGSVADVASALDHTLDEHLCEAAMLAQYQRDLLAVAEVRLLVDLERRNITDTTEGHRTAAWVAHRTGRSRQAIGRRLAIGTVLVDNMPQVLDAVETGRISFDHAEVLARACNPRIRDAFVGVVDQLIDMASDMVFAHWRAHVRDLVLLLDQDGAYDPAGDDPRNRACANWGLDGKLSFDGQLVGPHAHEFFTALEAETERIRRRWQRDADTCADITVPPLATLRALAFVELVVHGRAQTATAESEPASEQATEPSAEPGTEPRPAAEPEPTDRPDTASSPAGRDEPHRPASESSTNGAHPTNVSKLLASGDCDATRNDHDTTLHRGTARLDDEAPRFHTDPTAPKSATPTANPTTAPPSKSSKCEPTGDTARGAPPPDRGPPKNPPGTARTPLRARPNEVIIVVRPNHPTRPLATPDGHAIDPTTAELLGCSAAVRALRLDHRNDHVTLDLGRSRRLANDHQRLVAAIRDGGCVYPGCDCPLAWCDLHHIDHWANGGPTDLSNLIHLCRHHHGVTHRKGWTLTATPTGLLTWTTPTGRTLTNQLAPIA